MNTFLLNDYPLEKRSAALREIRNFRGFILQKQDAKSNHGSVAKRARITGVRMGGSLRLSFQCVVKESLAGAEAPV